MSAGAEENASSRNMLPEHDTQNPTENGWSTPNQSKQSLRGSRVAFPEPSSGVPVAMNVTSPVEIQTSASGQGWCDTNPRCDWQGLECFGFEFGIDTNYFDCHDSHNCVGDRWAGSACDCALQCFDNPDCQTWVWETDKNWCWQKRKAVHSRKAHSCRISGSRWSCHHG